MSNIVSVKNLNIKDNKNNTLVYNVSLNIKKGEIFGLVGESGSGKTLTAKSIINVLPKELKVSADELVILNENLNNLSSNEKKKNIGKNIGFIPQNTIFYLHPMIKIKNQITDGYIEYLNKSKKEGLEKAAYLLGKLGFSEPKSVLNYHPYQLSGGMRQRVNIAMALMNDPKLIIADEPTTALDSTIQRQVVDYFKSINEEMGVSILLISHDLGLIKGYSNSVDVMYSGQIVESGHSDEIFNNPKHPYTQMLIKLIPSFKMKKHEPLPEISGYVQEKGRDIKSCIFKYRCPYVMDSCKNYVEENYLNGNHYYKCNLK